MGRKGLGEAELPTIAISAYQIQPDNCSLFTWFCQDSQSSGREGKGGGEKMNCNLLGQQRCTFSKEKP